MIVSSFENTDRHSSRSTATTPYRLMLAFMLTTVLAPATILNKVLFVILMLWTLHLLVRRHPPRPRLVIPAFAAVGIFLYGLLLSAPTENDHALAIQFFLATFVLLLIHFVEHFRIDMDSASETCGKFMVIVTAIYVLLALNPGLPYASEIVLWFDEISLSASAERDYLDAPVLTLALGTVPFLFVPWCLVTVRLLQRFRLADFVWLLLYGTAILLSGARGVVAVSLAFLAVASFWMTSPLTRLLLLLAACVGIGTMAPDLIALTSLFSSEEISNATKIGHFRSFIDTLDVPSAMFGNGLGSFYYSSGKGAPTQHTELTPIDLARYVGIPFAMTFYALLLLPRFLRPQLRSTRFLFGIAFLLYLVLSLTNPVLINSYGMLVVVWYWTKLRDSSCRRMAPIKELAPFVSSATPDRTGARDYGLLP